MQEIIPWKFVDVRSTVKSVLRIFGFAMILFAVGTADAQDQENWDKIAAAARKEGKVVIYGTSAFRPMVKEVDAGLQKKYGIKVEFLVARSREVRERINTEVRTKKAVGDVAQAGATSLPA